MDAAMLGGSWALGIAVVLALGGCSGNGEGSVGQPDPVDSGAGGRSSSAGGAVGESGAAGTGGSHLGGGGAGGLGAGGLGAGGVGAGGVGGRGTDAGAGGQPDAGSCTEGASCDDGDPCTQSDRCNAGSCVGTPRVCDDGVACNGVEQCDGATGACVPGTGTCGADICDVTTDTCATTCTGCLVAGSCFPTGAVNAANPCQICDVSRSTTALSGNAGVACEDDGNPCKTAGVCGADGTCARTPLTAGTACGTPAPCWTTAACDGLGACTPAAPLSVGDECTAHGHCLGNASAPACTCDTGYEADANGGCIDVDECARGTDDCDDLPDACVNTDGAFTCQCPGGYTGSGRGPSGCACARDDYSPSCEPWADVAVQSDHACGISAGALYCWGKNDDGELGVGDKASRATPARVGTETGWTAVAPGGIHTCGIRNGALYCWGGGFGRDLDFANDALAPKAVGSDSDWVSVIAGSGTTCGIRTGGALYCWGYDEYGSTGTGGPSTYVPAPTLVPLVSGCTSVTLWVDTAAAVCDGKLYGWGAGSGYVGDGATTADEPLPVQLGTASDWTRVDRGNGSACAVNASGAMWCWGILGTTTIGTTANAPTLDPARSDWATVATGGAYACGITTGGSAYCWGFNDVGQLGDGTTTRQTSPVLVRGQCQRLAAGMSTTFGIFDGGLYSWGSNDYGVRGVPVTPRQVGGDSDWTEVTAGLYDTCGIRNGGELYCWGAKLDVAITAADVVPKEVGTDSDWTHVDAGWDHACGLRGGALYCWGTNERGGLGGGTTTTSPDPVQIGTATDWLDVQVSNGVYGHTCGVRAGGALYCWGSNDMGQVGDGSTTNRLDPTLIGSAGWSTLDLGGDYSCGVREGGLFCWGDQASGQLGNGVSTYTAQKTPVRNGTSSTWAAVSAGWEHGCGIDSGALYCWGEDTFGQLGIPATTTRPALVDSTRTWAHVASGTFSTCGTTAAGALLCWGSNRSGELGTGGPAAIGRPLTVVEASGWQSVAAGSYYFCGIRGGALYCWGKNEYGALGTGENLVPGAVASHLGGS